MNTTPHDDDPLIVALRALRVDYLAAAPTKVAELWSAFDRMQNGDGEGAAILRTLVHKLAGTGTSYGLPEVTDEARAAEQVIDRLLASPSAALFAELRTHLAGVAGAFERARSTE